MTGFDGTPTELNVACCAFAALLLTQLLAPLVWLRERLFGPRAQPANGAAAWSPGTTAAIAQPPVRFGWRYGLLLAVAVELALLAAGYQALRATAAPATAAATWTEALHASWCGSGPLARTWSGEG